MRRFRPVIIAGSAFSAGALCLWGLVLSAAQGKSTPAWLCVQAVAAGTSTVVAALCWLVRRQGWRDDDRHARLAAEYQRREAVLIRTISRLGGSPTGPIPRLRVVAPAQASASRRRP